MAQRESLKTSWVYALRKEELMSYLMQCAQDSSGTVDEMRKRMAKFITAEHDDGIAQKLLEWQKQHEQNVSGSLPTREDRITIIELVRKWGLRYDGGKDVLKFVDRLEELAAMYEIDLSGIVPIMCELLKDRALIWFRNNHKSWEHWAQLKKDLLGFFLPPRYMENLDSQIRSRTQRPRENFKDYVLALQDLMYHSSMSKEEKLEIIFRNSAPDYQWYIKRRDFETLDDLLSLAAEMEGIPTSRPTGRNEYHRLLKERPVEGNVQDKYMTDLTWEEEKIKATVFLNNQLHAAIIDTGATRSFVSPACIKQMRPRPPYIATNITVTLADGSRRQISSAVDVQVAIGNLSGHHKFLVMKEATEAVVLGLDLLRAFNTTIQCTGYSPAFITQGRNPRLPRALYDEVTIGSMARCQNPEEREKASPKQRYHHNLRRRNWTPRIGDQVLVRQHPLSKAVDSFAAKLAPKFRGPYIVTKFVSPVIVEISKVETNDKRTAHISALKTYYPNNKTFSLTSSRSSKHTLNDNIISMNGDQQKFEKARDKFRPSMRQEQEKRPHTISLDDDEIPSTSRGGRRTKKASKSEKRREHQTPQPKPARRPAYNTRHKRSPTAHFRMATSIPPSQQETVPVSDDEAIIPPPPPTVNPMVTPMGPIPTGYPTIPPPPPLSLELPYSAIPPPPPLHREHSPTPSPPVLSPEPTTAPKAHDPSFEQLPLEVQELVNEKRKTNKGRRYRTLQEVEGCLYRIMIKANGVVQLTLVEKRN